MTQVGDQLGDWKRNGGPLWGVVVREMRLGMGRNRVVIAIAVLIKTRNDRVEGEFPEMQHRDEVIWCVRRAVFVLNGKPKLDVELETMARTTGGIKDGAHATVDQIRKTIDDGLGKVVFASHVVLHDFTVRVEMVELDTSVEPGLLDVSGMDKSHQRRSVETEPGGRQ